ncbi:MerR family DNA-binding transcriptional regulator [Streptosporangium sp. NPDC002721]|uniref:MerR family DNA-binding transcriptional regulator n=1 Tax=Streptosporangium sp. NPDC002721 TaxID=3366188 RepID=UPI0036B2631D
MGWSTREIARLAGTTLRTVRHYHEIGLLDEPERLSNGYKVYRTEHPVRLLQIRHPGATPPPAPSSRRCSISTTRHSSTCSYASGNRQV